MDLPTSKKIKPTDGKNKDPGLKETQKQIISINLHVAFLSTLFKESFKILVHKKISHKDTPLYQHLVSLTQLV